MRARTVLGVVAALAAGGLAVASCKREPPPETRLLVLDGLEITLAEVAPYVTFLDSFLPEIGPKTKVQRVLDDHVIPLRLAQRTFAEQRRQLRERADALCAVAGNVAELEQQSQLVVEKLRSKMSRQTAHLPVAMFAFDPLLVGSVSKPIELPHGFFVVGVFDLHESPGMTVDDYVDALQVGFVTHTSKDWMQYYNDEKRRLANKATFVHPDYVHALPAWLSPPR